MQYRHRLALDIAATEARERKEAVFVVQDCVDGELYVVNDGERKRCYLVAEVFACVQPGGNLILNTHYVETYP